MDEDGDGLPRPVVTVTGGPASAVPAPATGRTGPLAVLLAVALVVGAAVLSRPPVPEPPPPLSVLLRLVPERITGSQSGVVVLPVDVEVRGSEARLDGSLVWAYPVRSTSSVGGRTRFSPVRPGRVVVLVQPDCRLLAPGLGSAMGSAVDAAGEPLLGLTVELAFAGPQDQRTRAVLDLGAEPAVAARVAALCRPPSPLA